MKTQPIAVHERITYAGLSFDVHTEAVQTLSGCDLVAHISLNDCIISTHRRACEIGISAPSLRRSKIPARAAEAVGDHHRHAVAALLDGELDPTIDATSKTGEFGIVGTAIIRSIALNQATTAPPAESAAAHFQRGVELIAQAVKAWQCATLSAPDDSLYRIIHRMGVKIVSIIEHFELRERSQKPSDFDTDHHTLPFSPPTTRAVEYFNRGLSALRHGNHQRALASFRAAVELDGTNDGYRTHLHQLQHFLAKKNGTAQAYPSRPAVARLKRHSLTNA